MGQSRLSSLIEALINTAIGFIVSFIAWPIAADLNGMEYTTGQHFGVVLFFTLLSVARGYVIRRWFNHSISKKAKSLAEIIEGAKS